MKRVKVGNVSVSSIIEREGPWRAPNTMFPSATPEKLAEVMSLVPDFAYDRAQDLLCITYQTFVLRTPRATVLIDTCVGEHQRRPPQLLFDKKPWLDGFAQQGLKFEDIDYVFCTHLHVDHVGWNTRLVDGRLTPTFPNAKYVFSRREYEHWKQATEPGFAAIHEDCVQPIVDAEGHVQPVAIRYRDVTGEHSDAPAYIGETSFMQSFWRVTGERAMVVEIHLAAPLQARARHRRELTRAAEAAIRAVLAPPAGGSAPDTRDDRPA